MTIKVTKKGKNLTVFLGGRLDTSTAPELEKTLQQQLNGITNLIFDLAELEYISSAGLRILLAAHKTMLTQGSMKVIHVNEVVMEVFDITGFVEILTIE